MKSKEGNNNELYVTGNGFDLYHRLETTYQAFAFFLQEKHSMLHEYLVNYYGLPWLDKNVPEDLWNPQWSYFEKAWVDLDIEIILGDFSDLSANPAAEDFRSRDWHTYQFEMERIVDVLTEELSKSFKEFILSVHLPSNPKVDLLDIRRYDAYLNFNYTNTLEKIYRIKHSAILYVHGFALNAHDKLILGHDVDPSSFKAKSIEPPENFSEEELQEWYDRGEDGYEYSHDQAQTELLGYFAKSHKSTSEIINQNKGFFDSLSNISRVKVIGHSIGEVDHEYFKRIIKNVKPDAKWVVSYYSNKGKAEIINNLNSIGLKEDKIELVQINKLTTLQPTLFD